MTSKKTSLPPPEDAAAAPALRQGFLPKLIGYQIRRAHARMRRDFNQSTADLHLGFRPGEVSAMVLIIENQRLIRVGLPLNLARGVQAQPAAQPIFAGEIPQSLLAVLEDMREFVGQQRQTLRIERMVASRLKINMLAKGDRPPVWGFLSRDHIGV